MQKKKFLFGLILCVAGMLLWSSNGQTQEVLGSGRRKTVKVDYQRVIFGHKLHQDLSLKMAGGNAEDACKICHHKKRKGRDPRACRRCHAKRQVKAKGKDMCSVGCHAKAKRNDLVESLKDLPSKKARKGQLLKLKDAFHLSCKNCHSVLRAVSIDLDSTKYMAPILNCEGCHQAINSADAEAVDKERKAEKERTGDVYPEIIDILSGK